MSTRSLIGRLVNGGPAIEYIYCHFDGYPDHNGRILVTHYTDDEKVNQLIALGDLSSLGMEIGKKVDFNNRDATYEASKSQCVAYGRDREEAGTEPRLVHGFGGTFRRDGAEYIYIWNGIDWACYRPNGKMIDLADYKEEKCNATEL